MRDRIAIIDISTKKFKALSYKQYDENNLLQIVVMDNEEILDITGCAVDIYFELPSGKVIEVQPRIVDNTINIILASNILNEHGKVTFEIELSKSNQIVTVFSMYLNVEKSINEENTPIEPGESSPNVRHSHENKSVLDQITQEMLDTMDGGKIDLSEYVTKNDLFKNLNGYATEEYVQNKIDEAKIEGGTGEGVDLSRFATKDEVNKKADNLFKADMNIVSPLGGIELGADLNNLSLQDVLSRLLYPYVKPIATATMTFSPSGGIYEYGQIVVVTEVTTYVTKKSENISSISFLIDGYAVDHITKDVSNGGKFTKTFSVPREITRTINNTYFQVRVQDERGTSVLANTSALNFYYPYYYGVISEDEEITQDLIKGLGKHIDAKGNKTYTFNPKNQRIVIAYPSAHGMLNSILDPNGFEQLASFDIYELGIVGLDGTNQSYYVYYNKASTNKNFKMSFYY